MKTLEVGALMQQLALLADRVWLDSDAPLLKELLLFFDGYACGLPLYYFKELLEEDPYLAQPLCEAGQFVNIPPDRWTHDPEDAAAIDEMYWLACSAWRDRKRRPRRRDFSGRSLRRFTPSSGEGGVDLHSFLVRFPVSSA